MAVEFSGRTQKIDLSDRIEAMRAMAAKFRGGMGVYYRNAYYVDPGPDPMMTTRWSIPENVERRKAIGWRVVTADRAHLYGIRAEEIDRSFNRVVRLGQVLLEGDVELPARTIAYWQLLALDQLEGTTSELIEAMENIGGNPRDLENDPRYANRLRQVGNPSDRHMQSRQTTTKENKRLRDMRTFKQIRRDMVAQQASGLTAATPEMVPDYAAQFGHESGPQIVVNEGVREVVLSSNPDLYADFE